MRSLFEVHAHIFQGSLVSAAFYEGIGVGILLTLGSGVLIVFVSYLSVVWQEQSTSRKH
jgi:hypothetical protein